MLLWHLDLLLTKAFLLPRDSGDFLLSLLQLAQHSEMETRPPVPVAYRSCNTPLRIICHSRGGPRRRHLFTYMCTCLFVTLPCLLFNSTALVSFIGWRVSLHHDEAQKKEDIFFHCSNLYSMLCIATQH